MRCRESCRTRTPQPAGLTVTLTDDNDRVVSKTVATLAADAFGERRAADYQSDLPLDRLAAGEHLLTVEAAQG